MTLSRSCLGAILSALLATTPLAVSAEQSAAAYQFIPDAVPPQNEEGANFDLPLSDPSRGPEWFLAIYSGTTLGTYFYIASAICRTLEASFSEHHIHCVPLRSSGVGGNVRLMNDGRAQAIIVQSDTNYDAAVGERPILEGRSVMSLHQETAVLVVHPDSGIYGIDDLRRKRVNLGPEGSATRQLWTELLEVEGIALSDLRRSFAATQDSNILALCEGSIDAFATWIGHPSALVTQAIDRCGARVVGLWSPSVERMVEETDYYFEQHLPAGTYRNQTEEIRSYGFKASLIAHEAVPAHVIYYLVKTLTEEVELFRRAHPALASADAHEFFSDGNFLPFHRGAARYYRERGWLTDVLEVDPEDEPGIVPQSDSQTETRPAEGG